MLIFYFISFFSKLFFYKIGFSFHIFVHFTLTETTSLFHKDYLYLALKLYEKISASVEHLLKTALCKHLLKYLKNTLYLIGFYFNSDVKWRFKCLQ